MCMSVASPAQTITVGLVQMQTQPEPQLNLERAVHQGRAAAARGAQIVCLQELFRSRYFCQTEDTVHFRLAEPIPGPTTEILGQLAATLQIVLIAPVFEQRAPGLYHNSAVIFDADGSQCGLYRKMHIPDDPAYYEKFYFAPGDLGFRSYATRYGKIGVLICWDQWFPEAARLTALTGADILFYPTAIGWHPREKKEHGANQHSAWELMQRSHAVANGVYVAVANRVGREGKLKFWGTSFVAAPSGEIIAQAGQEREEILLARCDLDKIAEARQGWPFLRDRRIDSYAGLTSRFLDDRG